MRLSYLDILEQCFHDKFRGYNKQEVDTFLHLVADDFKSMSEEIIESFNKKRIERINIVGKDQNAEIEKRIFLQILDFLWRSHLQYLEHLRQVVGLRGYAGRDPLQEFKKEAFKLFESLLNKIKVDFITFLNNVEVSSEVSNEVKKTQTKIFFQNNSSKY